MTSSETTQTATRTRDCRYGSPWEPLGRSPLRYLISSDPWRALLFTALTVILGCLIFVAYIVIVLLPFAPAWSHLLGKLDRKRVQLLQVPRIDDPHRPVTDRLSVRVGVRLGESSTWREVVYSLVLGVFGPIAMVGLVLLGAFIAVFAFAPLLAAHGDGITFWNATIDSVGQSWWFVPLALPVIVVTLYVSAVAAAIIASIAAWLLGPREEELAAKIEALDSSRGVLVGSFEAERERIERDLHDGAQQELVGAAMQLGELAQASEDQVLRAEVEAAQVRVERALASLRDTVRGVYPRVLEDHGLEAACAELGGPITVRTIPSVEWVPGHRLPAAIERALYYTVSEAVTNATKHGGASTVSVELAESGGVVTMVVTDDGVGGADPARGSGLAGLVERADALGAELTVDSPRGGPTVLRWTGRADR